MIYLIIVSIIWAVSFSLIKGNLTNVDPYFVAFVRLFISFLIFLPFLKIKSVSKRYTFHLIAIGAVQYGLMYITYIYSYQFLKAYEIVILTIFTPIFVVLLFDIWGKKFNNLHWLKAALAIVGAGIIVYSSTTKFGFWKGVLLIQLSNLFFAFGQVYYKKLTEHQKDIKHQNIFALLFFGAVLVSAIFSFLLTDFKILIVTANQVLTLLYLGIVASGLGFYFWNIGVTKVEAGSLAVLNNLKIPLGILFAFVILGESVDLVKLFIGSIIILIALVINNKYATKYFFKN